MQEVFYEETAEIQNKKSATTKFNIFSAMSVVSFFLCVVWAILVLTVYELSGNFLIDFIGILLPLLAFLIVGILFSQLKNRFYAEYDYTFVTGSVRISKVIKNTKRRLLLVFDTVIIEKMGKYGSNTYLKYQSMPGINKLMLTSNDKAAEGKTLYYLVINDDVKKLLVLECTEIFMVNILKFSNKSIVEEDFK